MANSACSDVISAGRSNNTLSRDPLADAPTMDSDSELGDLDTGLRCNVK